MCCCCYYLRVCCRRRCRYWLYMYFRVCLYLSTMCNVCVCVCAYVLSRQKGLSQTPSPLVIAFALVWPATYADDGTQTQCGETCPTTTSCASSVRSLSVCKHHQPQCDANASSMCTSWLYSIAVQRLQIYLRENFFIGHAMPLAKSMLCSIRFRSQQDGNNTDAEERCSSVKMTTKEMKTEDTYPMVHRTNNLLVEHHPAGTFQSSTTDGNRAQQSSFSPHNQANAHCVQSALCKRILDILLHFTLGCDGLGA